MLPETEKEKKEMTETEEKIVEMLNDNDDTIDYASQTKLIDDRILDSFAIISLVADLEDEFGVQIGTAQMTAANFNSVAAIAKMVESLEG